MTHPPGGPVTPPPPSGPRAPAKYTHPLVKPLDPDSPAGREATEALSQVLAEIQLAIWRRRAAASASASRDAA